MKRCSSCKQLFDESAFYKNKSRKDQLACECKECAKIRRRKYYREHREEENRKSKIRMKEYYQKNKDRILKRFKEYRKTKRYKEIQQKSNKEWRAKNPNYFKEWRKKNPNYDREYSKTRTGKIAKRKAKRIIKNKRRKMKTIPLLIIDNFPVDCQYHHIHDWFVVSVPIVIHNSVSGYPRDKHRNLADDWIKKLFCIDIGAFLSGKEDFMCYNDELNHL